MTNQNLPIPLERVPLDAMLREIRMRGYRISLRRRKKPSELAVNPDKVIDTIAARSNLTREQIFARNRKHHLCSARQKIAFFLKCGSLLSYPQISKILGGDNKPMNHATTMHSVRTVFNMMDTNTFYNEEIEELIDLFRIDRAYVERVKAHANI